jgi:hypothetical protein
MSNIDFQNGLIVGLAANGVNIPMIVNKINTEAKWLEENPVLLNGEIIAVTFTSGTRLKVGDGVKAFSELEYLDADILQAQSELQSNLQKKADLDDNGIVLTSQLPSYVDDVVDSYITTDATDFSLDWLSDVEGNKITPEKGKIYLIITDGEFHNKQYRWSGTTYSLCNPSDVNSVNGKTGIVELVPSDVGAEPQGAETRAKEYSDSIVGDIKNYWQYSESTTDTVRAINQNAEWVLANFEQHANKIQNLFDYSADTTKYPSAKATYDLMKFVYDLVMPVKIYDNPTGFEANNKDVGNWSLDGLDLTPYKRVKFYIKAAESGGTGSPSHIVEIHLDDRAKNSQGHFTGGHTAIFPESEGKFHNVVCSVSGDKTAVAFNKAYRYSASTAATSSGGRYCYLIEGYYI